MGSISEIELGNYFQKKPYLTKSDISLLWGKYGRNTDKKILQLLKKGQLISLKKGLYMNSLYFTLNKGGPLEEYIANVLYYPSYLSFEYVLQKEGVIPETVFAYTSAGAKTTRIFRNHVGVFIYRHLKPALFTGYRLIRFKENYKIKIATKIKALFDFLYLKPLKKTQKAVFQALFEDFRINWENITKEDIAEFRKYAALSKSRKMELLGKIIEKEII